MSTTNKNTNPNTTVGEESMTLKQRQTMEFKNGLSDGMRERFDSLVNKSKDKVSTDKESKSKDVSKDNSKEETTTIDKSLVTVESKNPKFDDFKSQLTPLFKESKQIVDEIYSKSIRLTYNYIQIGNILTKSKKDLSKDDYVKLIGGFDIDVRTAYRYIKLVDNDNVSKLTMDDMQSMIKPSMGKLVKMHSLSDEEFEKVLCGDDEPLLSNGGDTDNVYPLSDRIDNKTYDKLKKMTKIEIMKYFLDANEKLKSDIQTANSDNETLFKLIAVNDISFDADDTKKVS